MVQLNLDRYRQGLPAATRQRLEEEAVTQGQPTPIYTSPVLAPARTASATATAAPERPAPRPEDFTAPASGRGVMGLSASVPAPPREPVTGANAFDRFQAGEDRALSLEGAQAGAGFAPGPTVSQPEPGFLEKIVANVSKAGGAVIGELGQMPAVRAAGRLGAGENIDYGRFAPGLTREAVAGVTGEIGRLGGEALGFAGLDPLGLAPGVGETVGRALPPEQYWELGVEAVPGVGFGPDALRAGRRALRGAIPGSTMGGTRLGAGVPTSGGDEFLEGAARLADETPQPHVAPPEGAQPPVGAGAVVDQRQALLDQGFSPEEVDSFLGMMRPKTAQDIAAESAAQSQVYRETERLTKRAAELSGQAPAELRRTARRQIVEGLKAGEEGSVTLSALPDDVKLTDELTALVGLPRTLKASFDLSAPGRQGLALAFRHPQEWAESWAPMIKAWRSEEGMKSVNERIRAMMRGWQDEHGDVIHFYDTGAEAEGLMRVPGFEPAGKGVIGTMARKIPGLEKSERAYGSFLNYQKARTYDTLARSLKRAGETNSEVYKNLGSIIDHGTGFGAAPLKGRFEGQALFSQRYMASRFQFLTDPIVEGLIKGDMQTARAATENLVSFVGGMAGLLMLIDESGLADVTLDPRSSDFGKIRVGPQRIDLAAGFLPIIRTAGRLVSGEAMTTTGGVYDIDRTQEALKFFRNKLAPLPSEVVNRIVGENVIGEEPSDLFSLQTIHDLFMPLIIDATVEAFKETRDPRLAALAFGSELVGAGTSTYGSGQVAQAEIAQERFGQDYDGLFSEQQAEINAEIVESNLDLEFRNRNGAWWRARDDALARWQADLGDDPELLQDPFVQQALAVAEFADMDESLVAWARQTYGISRTEADAAVSRFLTQTRLNDYMRAYRMGVLAADPGFLETWDEAYESGDVEYAPPKWAREFVAEQVTSGEGR